METYGFIPQIRDAKTYRQLFLILLAAEQHPALINDTKALDNIRDVAFHHCDNLRLAGGPQTLNPSFGAILRLDTNQTSEAEAGEIRMEADKYARVDLYLPHHYQVADELLEIALGLIATKSKPVDDELMDIEALRKRAVKVAAAVSCLPEEYS